MEPNPYASPTPKLDQKNAIPDACEMCGTSYGLRRPQPAMQKKAVLLLILGAAITTIWVAIIFHLAPAGTPLALIAIAFVISPGTPVGLMAGCFRRVLKYRCYHCGHHQQVLIR